MCSFRLARSLKPSLVSQHQHFSFGLSHLFEPDFVDLLGGQIGRGHTPDRGAITRRPVGHRPDSRLGAALGRVLGANEGCETLVGRRMIILVDRVNTAIAQSLSAPRRRSSAGNFSTGFANGLANPAV